MIRLLLPVLVLALAAGSLSAQPPPDPKQAEKVARTAGKQLRSHMVPALGAEWNDFALRVTDKIGTSEFGTSAGWEEWADGTATPHITITRSTLTTLASNEDALALVLAHEHARLILGLVPRKDKPHPIATDADADLYAVKLVLHSGYSLRRGLEGVEQIPEKSRPMWFARIVKLLEKADESVWRSMPAFACGLVFLAVENHLHASACFEAVTKEFPTSPEAWAQLGYARLMWYFDADPVGGQPGDLRGHALGLSHSRRTNRVLRENIVNRWLVAVEALRVAEKLKPGQPAVLAHLGLAYLLDPSEKGFDEAEKYLTAARDALKKQLNPSSAGEIELLVNLAVVRLANNQITNAGKLLDEAATLAAKCPAGPPAQYTRAITFNRALVLAADGRSSEAAKFFLRFLRTTPRFDPWWSEGYRHYQALCKKLDMQPLARDDLQKPTKTQVQSVVLASGQIVRPGDDEEDVLSRLSKPTRQTPTIPRTNLIRLQFLAQGVEFISNAEVVFVVVAVSKKAAVPWPVPGRYGAPVGDLRVGMMREDVESLPGGTDFAIRPFAPQAGVCAYYPAWELAVIYDRAGSDGVVKAIIVGPRAR